MPRPFTLPILMYHKVGQPVAAPEDRFLNVSGESFRRQMRCFFRLGYQTRTFAHIVSDLLAGDRPTQRVFAVTFDDGYQCIGDCAAPILSEFGFTATVFVVSDAAGSTNAWDQAENRPVIALMNWEKLRALQSDGWEIGGHTRTHPRLGRLTDEEAEEEIRGGKQETEARMGQPLQTFCYPFGDYNPRTPKIVQSVGFLGACTTRSGLARSSANPMLLPRVKVAYRDGVVGLMYRMLVRPRLPDLRPGRPV